VKPIAAQTINQGFQEWINKPPIPTTSNGSLTSDFVNSDLVQKTVKPMIGSIVDQGIQQWINPPPPQVQQPRQQQRYQEQVQPTKKYDQRTQHQEQLAETKVRVQPTLSYDQSPSRGRKVRDKREVMTPILRD
jgi:hypothetical protein